MQSHFLTEGPIDLEVVESSLRTWLDSLDRPLRKVLLIPPDGTRGHSMAGPITTILYRLLQPAEVKVLPALGTHAPMTPEEIRRIFGELPLDVFIAHKWRTDVTRVGVVPGSLWRKPPKAWLTFPSPWRSTGSWWKAAMISLSPSAR